MTTSAGARKDLLFVLSVDAEEEWDWAGPFPEKDFSVTNAEKLAAFQGFCQGHGIRPTYFVDYAIAADEVGARTLKPLVASGACEVGAHLHPWANPPFFGETTDFESHVVNLSPAQTAAKLDALLEILHERLGVRPRAFRSGRWGVNASILDMLRQRGFSVDSSMYPCFSNEWFDCEETPLRPYWPDFRSPTAAGAQRDIMEIPVTVGFNRRDQRAALSLYKAISRPALEPLRLVGAFWQSRLLRKLYLSPEVISGEEMYPLVDHALDHGYPLLHMFLHSSSLIDHSKGMLSVTRAFDRVTRNIEVLLDYAATRANLRFCTISEAATLCDNHRNIAV